MNASENEPIVPLGAEMALVPEGYKPRWEQRRLYRSKSILGPTLREHTVRDTRKLYNKHGVKFQCQVVLGSFDGADRTCWLCGFPITHLSNLKNPETDEYVFQIANTMQDDGTCEHVLPVKLAHGILELLHLDKNQEASKKLVHTEYEFAHNYCNELKSDEYFVSLPKGSTNLCNLQLKESIIKGVLGRIFFKRKGRYGSQKYSVVSTVYNGRRLYFPNIVQAYCFTSDPERFLASPKDFFLNQWRPSMMKIITEKMKRVIGYIKEADDCAGAEEGRHYRGFIPRLQTGLENLKEGTPKGPSGTERLKEPFKSRMRTLHRQPSLNNILATVPLEERIVPFSAEPFRNYIVDKSTKRKVPAKASPKTSPGPRILNNNNNNNNNNNSPAVPVENSALSLALAAAGAGAGAEPIAPAVRRARVLALAEEVSNDEAKVSRARVAKTVKKQGTLERFGFYPKRFTKKAEVAEEAPAAEEAPVAEEAPFAPPRRPVRTRKIANSSSNSAGSTIASRLLRRKRGP